MKKGLESIPNFTYYIEELNKDTVDYYLIGLLT